MATYVAWNDYYSVGDPSLDGQHRQIILIINELYEAMQEGTDHKRVKPLLDKLVQYTLNHFKCEEQMLAAHDYPDLAEHKALHDKLRQKVIDLRENASLVTEQNLLQFLKQWWLGHIQGCDKTYAPYLQLSASRR